MSKNTPRMLVALAHPDDESFGMAGTLALYADRGVDIHLICATNGDVGEADPKLMAGHESLAELRLSELRCAVQILGVQNLYTFGYRDSGMAGSFENEHPDSLASAALDEVAGRIVRLIRAIRPQIMVTFDPRGGYGHPDHIKMHQAAVCAFEAAPTLTQYPDQIEEGLAPYQPQKLYFMTFDRRWLRWMVRFMSLLGHDPEHFGRNGDVNLLEIAAHQFPIHAYISTKKYTEIAERASQCHASQLGGFRQPSFLQKIRWLIEAKEDTYMRAHPPANGNLRERDLFEGVHMD